MFNGIVRDAQGRPIVLLGRKLTRRVESDRDVKEADWRQARPGRIKQAMARAAKLPSGGWYVLDGSRSITRKPRPYWVDGHELVAWRCKDKVMVGPNRCPHMGGPLSAGHPRGERLVCPWHGLSVCSEKRGSWKPLTAHDDGHLVWVQPDGQGRQSGKSGHDGGQSYEPGSDERGAEALTSEPILPPRPKDALAGVIRVIARCEPSDVIANRLDPWHGARYHQHTFARLRVLEEKKEAITVQVAFRVAGPVCTEVICTFHTPEPRTIVMTIIDGEGKGSIVETHATPLTDGWSAVTELIMATSDRYSFRQALRMRPLLEPLLGRTAKRLWNDDAAYAERSYALRSGLQPNEWSTNAWQRAPGTPYPR